MAQDDSNPTLEALDRRLKKLENRGPDWWQRVIALAAILIPAAITAAGYLVSQGINEAQLATSAVNSRVAQADLVNGFMNSLMSENPNERALATEAIVYAIPDYGPVIAQVVGRLDPDSLVRNAARSGLDAQLTRLVVDLFAEESEVRIRAADRLVQGWRADQTTVPALLTYAEAHLGNANGVFNTLVVLNGLDARVLQEHQAAIEAFLDQAGTIGSRTQELAQQVRGRL